MRSLLRIVKYSWKNLFRNTWIGLATVFVFMMALLSVNVLLGVNAMMSQVNTLLENKVDATITFKPGTPEDVMTQAKSYLASLPQVRDVGYVPPAEVLKRFKERNARNVQILAGLEEVNGNPLGGQIIIKAVRPEDYPFLLQAVQGPLYEPFIQSQTYDDHRTAIANIQEASRTVRIIGAILVAIFSLFGMLIAFNAIRIAIYTQREEIAIMRLVGASSSFIRGPFLLEGVWLALLSLGASAFVVWVGVRTLEPMLSRFFDGGETGLQAFFFGQWQLVAGIESAALIALVVFVSWIAVGRYMKR